MSQPHHGGPANTLLHSFMYHERALAEGCSSPPPAAVLNHQPPTTTHHHHHHQRPLKTIHNYYQTSPFHNIVRLFVRFLDFSSTLTQLHSIRVHHPCTRLVFFPKCTAYYVLFSLFSARVFRCPLQFTVPSILRFLLQLITCNAVNHAPGGSCHAPRPHVSCVTYQS